MPPLTSMRMSINSPSLVVCIRHCEGSNGVPVLSTRFWSKCFWADVNSSLRKRSNRNSWGSNPSATTDDAQAGLTNIPLLLTSSSSANNTPGEISMFQTKAVELVCQTVTSCRFDAATTLCRLPIRCSATRIQHCSYLRVEEDHVWLFNKRFEKTLTAEV